MVDIHLEALLKSGRFVKASPDIKQRLILAVVAQEGQGKTHFSFTAPDTIVTFNADFGLEGVIHKFIQQGKTILEYQVPMPNPQSRDVEKEAQKVWDDLEAAYDECLRNPSVRTIIFDTATEIWEVVRLAYLGKLTEVMPHHYTAVNAQFRRFLKRADKTDKNLILLQKMKPTYVGKNATGDYEIAGFNDTPYIVQAVIFPHRAKVNTKLADGTVVKKGEFYIEIGEKCRHNPAVSGTIFTGELANFPWVAATILEGTDPSTFM
uniref:Putative ATPase domain containing protein n=1 Tax=viral metagenome TaxID=1070528 RepID=A0A6H2A3W1_9ZZZZ